MEQPETKKIPVGISACLLGANVRHDGGHKRSQFCTDVLSQYFEFHGVCPEAASGFGTPRRAMHLVETATGIRLRDTHKKGQKAPIDRTPKMAEFTQHYLPSARNLRGFILMQKSPSCGLERVRIYNDQEELLHRNGSGLFASELKKHWPLLPLEEAGRLHDERICENFIERVYVYDDWMRLIETGLTPETLLDFHSRHKFQLLAHDQAIYRQLGPLLANFKGKDLNVISDDYIQAAMRAMTRLATPGAYVNAMQHLTGYLRDSMDKADYAIIHEYINAYQLGHVPLVVPMILIRNGQNHVQQPYLAKQNILNPYPDTLGLRNRL